LTSLQFDSIRARLLTLFPMYSEIPPISVPHTSTSSVTKRIYLCRHGETGPNALGVLQGSGIDEQLNGRGVLQAQCLRDRLQDVTVDLVVSSRLKRAAQTADIVAEYHPAATRMEEERLAEISWYSNLIKG
jgi:phosphohistidine phosphatase SixA